MDKYLLYYTFRVLTVDYCVVGTIGKNNTFCVPACMIFFSIGGYIIGIEWW